MTPDLAALLDRLGIVLIAAGEGLRLGSRPKCLLQLAGEPLIKCQLNNLLALNPASIVVVLGHHGDVIEPVIAHLPLQTIRQPAARFTQADSVRLGLSLLPSRCDHIMICPCDLPALTVDDYRELLSVYLARDPGVHFVGPWVNGLPGNPVVFDTYFRDELLANDAVIGSGKWRDRPRTGVLKWHTDNNRYRFDIDTDADRRAFELQYGQTLRWPGYLET